MRCKCLPQTWSQRTNSSITYGQSIQSQDRPRNRHWKRLASDVIRRMNNSARDREGHVRELLEYEREFRKIAGEVGGSDLLAQLDELTHIEDLYDAPTLRPTYEPSRPEPRILEVLEEEPRSPTTVRHHHASDWELDPDRRLGDEDEMSEPPTSPMKDSFHLCSRDKRPSYTSERSTATKPPALIHNLTCIFAYYYLRASAK